MDKICKSISTMIKVPLIKNFWESKTLFIKRVLAAGGIFYLLLFSSFCRGEKVKPHILLITVDTLRQDHLSSYSYARRTTPFIDGLVNRGMKFEYVFTPEPLTGPSHASILTSLHPVTHDIVTNSHALPEKVQTMAEVLKKGGYYTIGAVGIKFLAGKFNFNQGFDGFSDSWEVEKRDDKSSRVASSVTEDLIRQVDGYLADPLLRKKPLFMWVHFYDPHTPYTDWKDIVFKNKLAERDGNEGILNYDKEIRYTDRHIGKIYTYLQRKGLGKHLTTCITADHGEQLGERGHFFKHVDFYSENTLVPLVFEGYGIPDEEVVDTYVSTMDIAVTLLKRAGLKFDFPVDGIDLLNIKEKHKKRKFLIVGNPIYSRSLQLVGKPYSYILNLDPHIQDWYITGANGIAETLFKPLHKRRVIVEKNKLLLPLRDTLYTGRKFLVLRADLKKDIDFTVNVKVKPYLFSGAASPPQKIKQLNVIYPVTSLDRLVFNLQFPFPEDTAWDSKEYIDNIRFALISKKEFPVLDEIKSKKIVNQIHKDLKTPRKRLKSNELFDLSKDIKMQDNIILQSTLKPIINLYRKMISSAFKYHWRKKNRLLKGVKEKANLSKKEKEMLKSLGYL